MKRFTNYTRMPLLRPDSSEYDSETKATLGDGPKLSRKRFPFRDAHPGQCADQAEPACHGQFKRSGASSEARTPELESPGVGMLRQIHREFLIVRQR